MLSICLEEDDNEIDVCTLDTYLIMVSDKKGGIKYHFLVFSMT